MARVLFISAHGERQVKSGSLSACIAEANRLNTERGCHAGVHVVERKDGTRITANECLVTKEKRK